MRDDLQPEVVHHVRDVVQLRPAPAARRHERQDGINRAVSFLPTRAGEQNS